MRKDINFDNVKNIHFIGVNGISMSGLAKYCSDNNFVVSGSDCKIPPSEQELTKRGVTLFNGHDKENVVNAHAVVYTSAISDSNVELVAARKQNKLVVKRSELLGSIIDEYPRSVAVSGSHGKTTSTAMIAEILIKAGLDPTVFVGGNTESFGNYRKGDGKTVVAEACEYKKNLLDIAAKYSVVLNIDDDHMDTYKDMKDVVATFNSFAAKSYLIVNADDVYARQVFNSSTVTFGIENVATYSASKLKFNGCGYSFMVKAYGMPLGKIELKIPGKHNVYNALAAIAVADAMRIPFGIMKAALENFVCVKRRCELIGEYNGAEFFADYAHHPEEITATLNAFKEVHGKVLVVFQPHTYSRTRLLMGKFIDSLINTEKLVIFKTYSAREDFDIEGDAKTLFEKLISRKSDCDYVDDENELLTILNNAVKVYKKVLFLGAGDIYDIANAIVKGGESLNVN